MKRYRFYFNRLNEAPQIWSVDEGNQSTEINVTAVRTIECATCTGCDLSETVNRDRPRAWVETVGWLTIEAGVAVIRGGISEMQPK